MLTDPSQMTLTHSQVSDAKVEGDTRVAIRTLLSLGPTAMIEKVGALGKSSCSSSRSGKTD